MVPGAPAASRIASTSARGSALGSRLAGVGGFTPLAGSTSASPSASANLWNPRTATTVRAAHVELSGGWSAAALAQRDEEGRDRRLGDRVQRVETGGVEVLEVAPQVAPVRRERVGGQPALDRQVVEVGADRALDAGDRGGYARSWASTSSGSTASMPTASPTGSLVRRPA